MREPSFTVGIEEEYLIIDAESRNLIPLAPETMLPACERLLAGQVTPEFLQCQIEVGTRVCDTLPEARRDLARLRATVSGVARDHGLRVIASSTHPFAVPGDQHHTPKERYHGLAEDLQQVARRLVICGMHVHVGIEDEDLRIDLMNQAAYILPHLLALSTSSPFWQGHDTGLRSYRIAVWNELPRTGLPESFESAGEYRRHVDTLVRAGIIEDATKLWWDLRPSHRFPTLEMRITDVCTRLDDAICIAALLRCWLRMLYRLRRDNMRWRRYAAMLLSENRWRAQRYGLDRGLVDFGRGEVVAFTDLMAEILELVRIDAEHFGCVDEVTHALAIVERGTSAHRQVDAYREAIAGGAESREALRAVVDLLVEETVLGL